MQVGVRAESSPLCHKLAENQQREQHDAFYHLMLRLLFNARDVAEIVLCLAHNPDWNGDNIECEF